MSYCPKCGIKRRQGANFCYQCGHAFGQPTTLVPASRAQLSSFDPLRQFSEVLAHQLGWLRQESSLEPLQQLIDNIGLRTLMEQVTHQQREQAVTGYQAFNAERIELFIDQVRNARRLANAEIDLEVKQRNAQIDNTVAEREHQRRLELMRVEHQHQEKMMQLKAELELVNAIIQSYNQLRLIQLEAEAKGLADIQQMKLLTQIIRQGFTALAEIDAGQIEYARRIEELDFENLEHARSFQLIEELVQAVMDRIAKGVLEYGTQPRANPEARRSP